MNTTIDELMKEYHRLEQTVNGAEQAKKKVREEASKKRAEIDRGVLQSKKRLQLLSRLIALYGEEAHLPGLENGLGSNVLLQCPECESEGVRRVYTRSQNLGIHRSKEHGYVSPHKERNKKFYGNRKAKAVESTTQKKIQGKVQGK